MSPIESAALKAGISGAGVALVLFRVRRAGMPRSWLGLARPNFAAAAPIVLVYLAWMLGTDYFTHWRGPWDFAPWRQAPVLASVLRVMAVCLFGPAVEELVFRGVGYAWLRPRIGTAATIALTAAAWSILHFSYDWSVIGIIFIDGLLLGLARWRTGSVYVPIAMHILYNLYAIW